MVAIVDHVYRDKSGEENKLLPQLNLSLPNYMDFKRYFSGYNLKTIGTRQKCRCTEKYVIWTGNFSLSYTSYVTVDFRKVVSDLFYDNSTLVKSECIKRKRRLSE